MKRPLLIIGMFLLLGVVVNVAVAWGCAMCVDVDVGTYKGVTAFTTEEAWTLDVWSCGGAKFIHSLRQRGSNAIAAEAVDPGDLLPYWSKLAIPSATYAAGLSDFEKHFIEARGWPLLALWCELSMTSGNAGLSYSVAGAIETPLQWESNLRPRTLPLRPIGAGFIVNTMFYAVMLVPLWLLIRGGYLFAFRRAIRIRRGLCPACAYPTGESDTCAECGKPLPNRRATT